MSNKIIFTAVNRNTKLHIVGTIQRVYNNKACRNLTLYISQF